ncbi:unnamed protein product [Miscanthus lutarioriparius]|uniref:non-specific serine/threonine protein kinase n=1 Tax=Miscanthus lutarioriparius TaxID=422564 RepID=A0A811PCJ9_9POAL|nr:unnamed protein product [Miscanthus lutarioriparius]
MANRLYWDLGKHPSAIGNLVGLQFLSANDASISRVIPDSIGKLGNLTEIYLYNNNLSGQIPSSIGNLSKLAILNAFNNNLEGPVPPSIGKLKSLVALVLSWNHLNGSIPREIFQLSFSYYLDLSYNSLSGPLPSQLSGQIPESIGKCTVLQELWLDRSKDKGRRAHLNHQWLRNSSTKSFVAECETLRRVRHRCLMKIITCCSSINKQGRDFKALVFEFMPNGSLNRWLHKESTMPTLNNTLSLAQRLDVAVDIMDALDYLHNHCQPSIIHCDLKPSNILLKEDMSARVGDFGISRIISESESKILQNSNSTVGIRGSIGYVAPEYGEGSSITTFGDVYSLGILLLEVFTGRSPTDDIFRGSMDLHKFSEDALPDNIWEIADKTMWLHTSTYDSNTRNMIEKCLVHVIALGVSCSRKQPR